MIRMIHGDELPSWEPSITIDGTTEDYSVGHSFQVTLTRNSEIALTKTAGITGLANGTVRVSWAADELDDVAPATYRLRLRIRRDIDDRDLTVETTLTITA